MKAQESSASFMKESFLAKNLTVTEISKDSRLITDGVDIGPDDEVWLLQCPKTIDIDALINRKIKIPGKTHHEHIESVAEGYSKQQNVTLATTSNRGYTIKTVPVSGRIFIRERLKIQNLDETQNESLTNPNKGSERIKFPDDLKIRHPLHGADYEDKIEVKPAVAERLKQATRTSSKVKKQKRNRSGVERRTVEVARIKQEENNEVVVKKEKKRKRKHEDSAEEDSTHKSKKIKTAENVDHKEELEWIKQL